MFDGDIVVVAAEVVFYSLLFRAPRHNVVIKLTPLQRKRENGSTF